MCGIAGFVSNQPSNCLEKVQAAAGCLTHRGPEGANSWINGDQTAALGHTRLVIIDKSSAAAQPMHFVGRYTIIHNGEVYNYVELRQQLETSGTRFTSSSDTEVIVAAYERWGSNCLQYLDGMFAFAIWDEQEKRLFAARDRFGEKPFYLWYDGKALAFASELKGLWQMQVPKEVNRAMLYNFLTIGYTANPASPSETFYYDVHQLPPAAFLEYSPVNNSLRVEKYWQPVFEQHNPISEGEAIEQFSSLLAQSVRRRLRSDVPVGTSLSGGLDSSCIAALCSQQSSGQYTHKAFTAVFDSFEKNERSYAALVAGHLKLEHITTTITAAGVPQLMDEVMRHQEVPFASASALVQYKVYETAKRNGVTVLLDGQGADEVLAGYYKYYRWYWQELYRKKQLQSSGELQSARALGVKESFSFKHRLAALLPHFAAALQHGRKQHQAFRHSWLTRGFAFENKPNLYYTTPARFDLNGMLYFNTFVNGLNELLHLADRNSMAHATEVRLPYLSHELVEFLFTLPPQLKIRGGWTKWLLRKTAEPLLPPEITWRKDKVGFEPPQKQWMEDSAVQQAVKEAAAILVDQKILRSTVLYKKVQPHEAHAADNSWWKLWSASYLFR